MITSHKILQGWWDCYSLWAPQTSVWNMMLKKEKNFWHQVFKSWLGHSQTVALSSHLVIVHILALLKHFVQGDPKCYRKTLPTWAPRNAFRNTFTNWNSAISKSDCICLYALASKALSQHLWHCEQDCYYLNLVAWGTQEPQLVVII